MCIDSPTTNYENYMCFHLHFMVNVTPEKKFAYLIVLKHSHGESVEYRY